MRRAEDLVTVGRAVARNVANADGTFAITTDECLQYLNDAQDRMQNLISAQKNVAKIFVTERIISLVANQAEYTVPDRVLLNKQIEYVEFSATGATTDYVRLEKLNYFNRDTYPTTYPHGYFKRGNQILLQPTPQAAQGTLRISYERDLDDLDVTRARINGTPVLTVIDLTHATGAPTAENEALFINGNYVCICDSVGNVMLRNGLISSYNAALDELTLAANVSTYLMGAYTLANLANGFLTVGVYTNTFSYLPDSCERYLVHYLAAQLFRKDSSNDYDNALSLVADIEEDTLKMLNAQTGEIQFTPQISEGEW